MACLIYNDEQGNATKLPLGKATLMLGSSEESGILLQDDSVSHNHASIIYQNQKFFIRDNGSTNGSQVNGIPVQFQALKNGDILQFGSYRFFFDEFYHTKEEFTQSLSEDVKIANPSGTQRKGQSYRQTIQVQSNAQKGKGVKMMLTESVNNIPDPLSNMSMVCGYLGFIAFLPAIITGHMANPKSTQDKNKQTIGIALGYTFFFLWLLIAVYYFNSTATTLAVNSKIHLPITKSSEYEYPVINSPLELLKKPMVWLPPKGIYRHILFNDANPAIDKNADLQKEVIAIKSVFLHGLVWRELPETAFKVQPALRKLTLTYETYRTNPTFWEYNSTMVPEKKGFYDPFFFPEETQQLFYEKDQSLVPPIDRFADPQFQWCFGVRGLTFDLPENFNFEEKTSNFRVILISKLGEKPNKLVINTLEGNLTRDEPKTYEFKVIPASLYAVVIYRITDYQPVVVSTYTKYFGIDESKKLEEWMNKNLKEVISLQPNSELSISSPFTITEKTNPPPPKPKVNFFIQEGK